MAMTLGQLRTFIAVVDAGSVRVAAESLFVSQPAVSTAIAGLADRVGEVAGGGYHEVAGGLRDDPGSLVPQSSAQEELVDGRPVAADESSVFHVENRGRSFS